MNSETRPLKNLGWQMGISFGSAREGNHCWMFLLTVGMLCLCLTHSVSGQEDDRENPTQPDPWSLIDDAVQFGIDARRMPGAVVSVGQTKKTLYRKAFGHLSLVPEKSLMKTDTVFDLASLTKPMVTATSIMILVERGKVRLRDPVGSYLPEFAQNGKKRITVRQLMTHVGGLTPDNALKDYQSGPEIAFRKIDALPTISEPGTRFAYSDVGFIVLARIVEKMAGMPIDQFAEKNIFRPLGMNETGYKPGSELKKRAAVTGKRDGKWIQGSVHDPRAFELGGVAGHAGLFSTVEDLEIFCRMLLGRGQWKGTRILSRRSVDLMCAAYELPGDVKRGLGWDKLSPYSSNRGELMTASAFGHGGFTGTSLWIDPELDLFVIFLSNRVHPDGKGSVNRLAGRIGTISAAYVGNQ